MKCGVNRNFKLNVKLRWTDIKSVVKKIKVIAAKPRQTSFSLVLNGRAIRTALEELIKSVISSLYSICGKKSVKIELSEVKVKID